MKKQRSANKKIILGLTGSFGSGKTTVAKIFKSFGAKVIDADKIAHQLIHPGCLVYRRVVKCFGRGILKKDKTIDRQKLAGIVFNNKNLLKRLNNIIHPEVIREIKGQIKSSKENLIILDVPLLVEAGLRKMVDKLIVVKISRPQQIRRIQNKLKLKRCQILKRVRCQLPLQEKVRLADFVIDNSGTIGKTKKQAELIRRKLWKN